MGAEKELLHRQLVWIRAISHELDRRYPSLSPGFPTPAGVGASDSLASLAPSSAPPTPAGDRAGAVAGDRAGATVRADASESSKLPTGCTFDRFPEILCKALKSPFPSVRKGAASALGKLSRSFPGWMRSEVVGEGRELMLIASQYTLVIVLALEDLVLAEKNPQARQYAIRALARYGVNAVRALPSLKDAARDMTMPKYVRTDAAEAVAAIQEANRASLARSHRWCSRCRKVISEAEYRQGMDRFGRAYCRHCFDEAGLESRNFEATVEGAKHRRSFGGTAVQSRGEKRIAEFLERRGLEFVYDERYRVAGDLLVRPDFYLPEFDLYIEYWGMDTQEYLASMRKKKILYQREGKKLISVSYREFDRIESFLAEKLSRYLVLPESQINKSRSDDDR